MTFPEQGHDPPAAAAHLSREGKAWWGTPTGFPPMLDFLMPPVPVFDGAGQ
jgi:hypothetical protein